MLEKIVKKYVDETSSQTRRLELIESMKQITDSGNDCFSCSGVCCSFVGNSMMVTPLEALELYYFLKSENRWNKKLQEELELTVAVFRLDRPVPSDGRRSFSRRRYTCTFFTEGEKGGCSIRKRFKPYGCLGFNAMGPSVKDGENCRSYIENLELREKAHATIEADINSTIKHELSLDWDKKNMPMALLEIFKMDEGK